MNVTKLKTKIFQDVDAFDKKSLEEFYSILQNYNNSKKNETEFSTLSKSEMKGIMLGLKQIEEGKTIPHHEVMSKLRKKYYQTYKVLKNL